MQTTKQEAINAITTLPDTATIDDIMYRLYVIDKIKRGLEAIDKGETITIDELQKEVESW
jgi:predicted transcriptional regulator